jgi:hypothetical protein
LANISSESRDSLEHAPSGRARLGVLALLTLLASAAIILFGSPLFQTLGFEYSGCAALILSLTVGIDSALSPRPARFVRGLVVSLGRGVLLALVPLLVSLLSLLWLPNCALDEGLAFYAEIGLPTALLAAGFGFGFCLLFLRRVWGLVTYLLFWLLTALLSLLPGYANPQLFSYGWQYGYFPGFIWDRAIELRPAYLAFRFENVLWLVVLLDTAYDLYYRERGRFILPGLLLVAVIALFGSHDNLGITTSQSQVEEYLSREAYLGGRAWVYYKPGSLTDQEIRDLQHDVPIYLDAIRETYGLADRSQAWQPFDAIHIYVYPDAETMERLIGTRAASIAKPWLGDVHIMKSALGSLKHELTHVVLRTIGNFPFYASWSTGLTEGAAVAMESPDGALFTNDELAAQLLKSGMASGVSSVMQFTGFASENSAKSYTLAGSFTRYLLKQYGARKFREVYGSLDYEKAYGKPIEALEREWRSSLRLAGVVLDTNDVTRLHALFGSPSILNMPCVRRLGKLERAATLAFEHDNYGDAYRASLDAYMEGGGASDAWNAARALVMLGRLDDARTLLDTARVANKQLMLGLVMGDLDWIAGDTTHALPLYTYIQQKRLSSSSFFTAYDRMHLMSSPEIARLLPQYLMNAYRTVRPNYRRALALLDTMLADHQAAHAAEGRFDRPLMILLYIKLRNLEEMGWPELAAKYDPLSAVRITPADSITSDDSLAIATIERHMWNYREPSWGKAYIPERYRNAANADLYEMQTVLRRQYR